MSIYELTGPFLLSLTHDLLKSGLWFFIVRRCLHLFQVACEQPKNHSQIWSFELENCSQSYQLTVRTRRHLCYIEVEGLTNRYFKRHTILLKLGESWNITTVALRASSCINIMRPPLKEGCLAS